MSRSLVVRETLTSKKLKSLRQILWETRILNKHQTRPDTIAANNEYIDFLKREINKIESQEKKPILNNLTQAQWRS